MQQSVDGGPVPVLIALGGNLAGPDGPPEASLRVALQRLEGAGVRIRAVSRFLSNPAMPPSGQPDFVNALALGETRLGPAALLDVLLGLEALAGRERGARNAARTLDLDLLAWDDLVQDAPDPVLPHPRLHLRSFVLGPLAEIAPDWRHPVLGQTAGDLARQAAAAEGGGAG